MPHFVDTTMSRKSFLRLGVSLVAGMSIERLVMAQPNPWSRSSHRHDPTHRFAMLSDTHIAMDPRDTYRGFFPTRNLQAVIQQIQDAKYDMAILSGDAARLEGKVEDYQQLKELLKPLIQHCPVAIGLGNHDDRDTFRQVFEPSKTPEQESSGRHVTIIDSPHAQWIVLDSLLYVNKVAGLLGKSQRAWLQSHLASHTEKPILLVVHHTLGDNDGELLDAGALLEICQSAKQVKAIFYGHSHQYEFLKRGHVHLINLPAIGYNFDDAQPVGWCSATLNPKGLSIQLHAIAGNQTRNGELIDLHWEG